MSEVKLDMKEVVDEDGVVLKYSIVISFYSLKGGLLIPSTIRSASSKSTKFYDTYIL